MGPPKHMVKKRKQKRDFPDYHQTISTSQSVPTTPNMRYKGSNADSDSDSAYGFHDTWGA